MSFSIENPLHHLYTDVGLNEEEYQKDIIPTNKNEIRSSYMGGINNRSKKNVPQYSDSSLPSNAIKILISNRNTKYNKKLLHFFNSNLESMNNQNIFFNWIIVYDDELQYYKEQNINNFPTLLLNERIIEGTDNVINTLKNIFNGSVNQSNINRRENNNAQGGADLRSYFLNELNGKEEDDGDDEDDNNNAFVKSISKRVANMNDARKISGQHSIKNINPEIHEQNAKKTKHIYNNIKEDNNVGDNNLKTSDILRSQNTGSVDDELMLKFWENLEETDMGD